jgi:TolB protein
VAQVRAAGALATIIGLVVWGLVAHFSGQGRHWEVADPAWSPDGTRIAFHSSRRDGRAQIYLVAANGTGLRRITRTKTYDREPAWSPDGKRIVYVSSANDPEDTLEDDAAELYVVSSEGGLPARLTHDRIAEADPAWSPAGNRIAFEDQSLARIYVVSSDGDRLHQIPFTRSGVQSPSWSPDGNRLVVSSGSNLYVIAVNGKRARRLTRAPESTADARPAWAPDGKHVAFDRVRIVLHGSGSYFHLFVVDADGSHARLLSDDGFDSSWSPDGSKIVFRRGNRLFVINADGSGLHRLTDG